MVTQSQVALQAIALVKALTELHNSKYPPQEFKELPPDNKGNPSWMTWCPAHEDISTPSLHVSYLDKVLVKCRAGCGQEKVLDRLKSLGLWNASPTKPQLVTNIPAHEEPEDMYQVCIDTDKSLFPDTVYTYYTAEQELAFWILRAGKGKNKVVRPYTSVTNLATGQKYFLQRMPDPTIKRPLYNLISLLARPKDPVIIVEGEKAAEAAAQLFPSHVVLTWSGGTGSVHLTNWTFLINSNIILWPDNDQPGIQAMEKIAQTLFSQNNESIKIVFKEPSKVVAAGWDLADCDNPILAQELFEKAEDLKPSDITVPLISDARSAIEEMNKRLIPIQVNMRDILIVNTAKYKGTSDTTIPFKHYLAGSKASYLQEPILVEITGNKKPVYAVDEWQKQCKDLIHDSITYDPSTENQTLVNTYGTKLFNLFTGFAHKPIKDGSAKCIIDHIILLLGDEASYLLSWLAHIIQYPKEKPGTFILLKGPGGTGKTLLAEIIIELFGHSNARGLTAKDMHSNFNPLLSSKLFVYIDEFYLTLHSNRHSADEFKSMLTTSILSINQKNEPIRQEPSYHRFMGTTNSMVPYTIDFDSRREAIFDVPDHNYVGNTEYFKQLLQAKVQPNVLSDFMYYLKNYKIDRNITTAPDSSGRYAMYMPTDPADRFLYDILCAGNFPSQFNKYWLINRGQSEISKWPTQTVYLPRGEVTTYIQDKHKLQGPVNSITKRLLELLFDKINSKPDPWQAIFEVHDGVNSIGKLKQNTFEFLPLAKLRQMFSAYHKKDIKWPVIYDVPEGENIIPLKNAKDVL